MCRWDHFVVRCCCFFVCCFSFIAANSVSVFQLDPSGCWQTVCASGPILCCQSLQYWEAPSLAQIVNLRQRLSKRLSPLTSLTVSFSSHNVPPQSLAAAAAVSWTSSFWCRSYLPGEPDPSQRRTQRWTWFHFFLCKQGSTSSLHNELFKAPICGYGGLVCPSHADDPTENLNYSCQGSLCNTGLITKRKQVARPVVRSLYQQTDSCQACPSRWHKERREEGKMKQ